MREIKFIGKRKDNGEWIEGSLCESYDERVFIVYDDDFCMTSDCCGLHLVSDRFYEVIPETVGQYTGMKDKNGTEIFEGDILVNQLNSLVDSDPFEVVWSDDCGGFAWRQGDKGDILYSAITRNCEAIGNIHDNPEVLEAEL